MRAEQDETVPRSSRLHRGERVFGEPTVSFTYTATGKRQTMTDASGETTYNYDNMDRLSSKITPEGTLSYTYDAAGNLASIASSNANGASMTYAYDNLNRVSSVTDKLGTTTYTYDGASNLYTATYPNTVQAQYQYDALNRISGLATQQSGYTYQRGLTGNLTNASELNGRAVTWSFDGIYRLSGETISGDPDSQNNGDLSYGLDPVGNRTSATSTVPGLSPVSGTYNADDELSPETYDQDGNVTVAEGKTYTYDSQNELVTMNGGAVQVMYDGDGNRVAKAVTAGGVTTTTYYLVDDLNATGLPQVMDELTNGVVTRTYTYGLQRISEDQVVNGAWTPSFYSYDGMGSVRQLTGMAGTVTDTYEYDAFGNEISHTGTTPNNFLYRGEQWDSDLALYYLRARYYNPLSGRFMGRDPLNEDLSGQILVHPYLYAGSDPVNYVDPSGKDLVDYVIQSEAAIPAAKLVSTYGCAANIIFTGTSLILNNQPGGWDLADLVGTTIGCLTISVPPESAVAGKVAKLAIKLAHGINYGFCGASIGAVVHDLNELVDNPSDTKEAGTLVDSLGSLVGCVTTKLGYLLEAEE